MAAASPLPARRTWNAPPLSSPAAMDAPAAMPASPRDWKPLLPHRGATMAPDRRFNPGWSRIAWTATALVVDLAFAERGARNDAARLNERTYLLGDVGEIFLQWPDGDRYIEIHVTPENRRLQLAWDGDGLARVRQGRAGLEDFTVADPEWVQSVTRVAPSFWSARVVVPLAILTPAAAELGADAALLATICRYDYSQGKPPVLSSTADFGGRPFHTREAWDRLVLSPAA